MGQLVLIVDTSAAMCPYWHDFHHGYVLPIVKFFSETQSAEKTLYTLVTYGGGGGGGSMGNMKCSSSTFNPAQLVAMLNNVKPGGGGLEDKTHLIDALSIALTLLCK